MQGGTCQLLEWMVASAKGSTPRPVKACESACLPHIRPVQSDQGLGTRQGWPFLNLKFAWLSLRARYPSFPYLVVKPCGRVLIESVRTKLSRQFPARRKCGVLDSEKVLVVGCQNAYSMQTEIRGMPHLVGRRLLFSLHMHLHYQVHKELQLIQQIYSARSSRPGQTHVVAHTQQGSSVDKGTLPCVSSAPTTARNCSAPKSRAALA